MNDIERLREQIKLAIRSGNMTKAWELCRVVVGMRIVAGEIDVKLKPPEKIKYGSA